MTQTFLFEIGMEEIPARMVTAASAQFKEKTALFLEENRLAYTSIEAFSTPRRLAIKINGLAEKQADLEEEAKGPAKKIALDAEGNWTKAASGFARGQGVPVEELFFKEIKGVDYVHLNKFVAGQTAAEILPTFVEVATHLTFPVTMHWGSHQFRYIRPIHWLVALLDGDVLPVSILDVTSDRISRGHRFLGGAATIDHADHYEAKLLEQFVVVDAQKREELIRTQIEALTQAQDWHVELDEDLLDEVNNLVEFPTAFVGNFEKKYLDIPSEVLITSMKEHQRYFDVQDAGGNLLPHFIGVRNGNSEFLANVARGNEKVLTARLEDAEFFYKEDQKLSIADCVAQLAQVTFHEKIGSMTEKMSRVGAIAQLIATNEGLNETQKADLARASQIYKFDLMTNMVGEFPELQGLMGEKYALMQGENAAVAQAIREHYMPISSEGELPQSEIGAVLAVADKIDTVLTFFNAGMIPTGSNDPYALRRQTYGIIRIIAQQGWNFPLVRLQGQIMDLINQNVSQFGVTLNTQTNQSVTDFIKGRIKQFLESKGIYNDIIEAVTSGEQNDLARMIEAARLLKEHRQEGDYRPAVEALTRVLNLTKKAELAPDETVQPNLFENDSESALYQAVTDITTQAEADDLAGRYRRLVALYPLIEAYFNQTMVMAEDQAIRANRLTQMKEVAQLIRSVASLDLLTIKQTTDK